MKELFAALDTPGGHMAVCIMLIVIGGGMHKFGLTVQGDTMITSASAAIFFAMKGQNGGRVTVSDPRANPVQPAVQEPKP